MSEEFPGRMFQEFAREAPGSEQEPAATGLGMAIVKRLLEKPGGEIGFDPVKDSGSEFCARLPLRRNQDQ